MTGVQVTGSSAGGQVAGRLGSGLLASVDVGWHRRDVVQHGDGGGRCKAVLVEEEGLVRQTLNGLVIRRSLWGHNDTPFGRPTPGRPVGRPGVGRPLGVFCML